jgi:hypothetical protein
VLPSNAALGFGLAWLCVTTFLYAGLPRVAGFQAPRPAVAAALAVLVRLVPALALPLGATRDLDCYRRSAEAFLAGSDVYTAPAVSGCYPYLPFQIYLTSLALLAARTLHVMLSAAVKVPTILADAGLVALLPRCADGERGREAAFRYALHPIPILVTAYHGQFDAIPLLFATAALAAWRAGEERPAAPLALGLGVAAKTWPAILGPAFLLRTRSPRRAAVFSALAAVPVAAVLALYAVLRGATPVAVAKAALGNAGIPGWWGVGAVLLVSHRLLGIGFRTFLSLLPFATPAVLAAVLATTWRTRREPLVSALASVVLSFYAVTLGFGSQYLAWLVPFGLLEGRSRTFTAFTALGAASMVVGYWGLAFGPLLPRLVGPVGAEIAVRCSGLPLWALCVGWWIARLTRPRTA